MGRRLKSTMLVSVWLSAGLDREKRRADRLAEECSRYEKRAAQGVSAANRAEAELETLRSARQLHGLQMSGCEDVRSSTDRAHQGVPCPGLTGAGKRPSGSRWTCSCTRSRPARRRRSSRSSSTTISLL